MHYLYIIYSKSCDKFYTGETYDLIKRIEQHRNHLYQNSFTKIATDWELVLQFECNNRQNAVFLEQFIKRMKSKKVIAKIILTPLILEDILLKKNN